VELAAAEAQKRAMEQGRCEECKRQAAQEAAAAKPLFTRACCYAPRGLRMRYTSKRQVQCCRVCDKKLQKWERYDQASYPPKTDKGDP
jgi:hypothetical protein